MAKLDENAVMEFDPDEALPDKDMWDERCDLEDREHMKTCVLLQEHDGPCFVVDEFRHSWEKKLSRCRMQQLIVGYFGDPKFLEWLITLQARCVRHGNHRIIRVRSHPPPN